MQWWVRLGNGQRRVIAGHGGEWWVLLFRLQDFRVLGSRDLGLGFQGSGFWGSGLQGFRSLQPAELRLLAPGCRPPPGQGAQGARPVLNASSFFFFFAGPFPTAGTVAEIPYREEPTCRLGEKKKKTTSDQKRKTRPSPSPHFVVLQASSG